MDQTGIYRRANAAAAADAPIACTETEYKVHGQKLSIYGGSHARGRIEKIARGIFFLCAALAILAVFSITLYMVLRGCPALQEVGAADLLFGTIWKPTAEEPSYGIAYIILTSIAGTAAAVLIGVPVGLLTAVFITEVADKRLANLVSPAVELLAAIPSVIYGLLGLMLLNPLLYRLEKAVFAGRPHQYTGGANLLAAVLVLAVMILPTVINISVSSIRAVPAHIKSASLAMGATKMQTVFKCIRLKCMRTPQT